MRITLRPPLRAPMPKQAEGMAYLTRMYRAGYGGLLFKEMRLGKTLTFIRFTKLLGLPGPFLIICPNTVKSTWTTELDAEREDSYTVIEGDKEDKIAELQTDRKWYIVNFEAVVPTLPSFKKKKKAALLDPNGKPKRTIIRTGIEICEYDWFAVVIDESVKIADAKSDTSKFFLRYFPHVKYKYCLCGNPIPEHEKQYVQQFIFVFGHFMGFKSVWDFVRANYSEIGYQLIPRLGFRTELYSYVHKWAFVCTRKEAGVGSEKVRSIREIEMTPKQKKAYNEVKTKWAYKEMETKYAVVKNNWLRDIASGFDISTPDQFFSDLKLKELNYLLSTELKKQQVIIWCKERHEADYLFTNLSRKYKTRLINGDVKREVREVYRKEFLKGMYQIQIATVKSLAKGTDWSSADVAIYYSMEYGADETSQSEDRIIHPLKKIPVLLLYLITKGTVDQDIYDMNIKKMVNSQFFMSRLLLRMMDRTV